MTSVASNTPQSSKLSRAAFEKVARRTHAEAGIVLTDSKISMIESRLRKRLIVLNLPDFDSYCAFLDSDNGRSEVSELISSLTTNVSNFFREDHHFDQLATEILPLLLDKAKTGAKVRIWSAGCSNGQEPYTIAMTVLESAPELAKADFRILATDIDHMVLETAKSGRYSSRMLSGLSNARMDRFGQRDGSDWTAGDALKKLIAFKKLNLLGSWPMKGPFDVIFCRNVVIYFDAETQTKLWTRFVDLLTPEGWLFAGHSERVMGPATQQLRPAGLTSYRRDNLGGSPEQNAKGATRWG